MGAGQAEGRPGPGRAPRLLIGTSSGPSLIPQPAGNWGACAGLLSQGRPYSAGRHPGTLWSQGTSLESQSDPKRVLVGKEEGSERRKGARRVQAEGRAGGKAGRHERRGLGTGRPAGAQSRDNQWLSAGSIHGVNFTTVPG